MAQVIKELVTRWTYKVDSRQVKAAVKQVQGLKKNIQGVKAYSSKFADSEINKVNRIRKAWTGLNSSIRNYRSEQAKAQTGLGGFKTFAAARALGLGAGSAAGLAAGGGIAALTGVGAALRAGMGAEVAQVEYEGFLKSADKAKLMLKELAEFGSKTPFEIPQLENLGIQLLAGGFAAKEIIPTLGRLGDVTGGVADKLNRLLINLIEIRGNNRAYTRDLRQFVTAGVPIYQQLEKQLKKTRTEIAKMAEKGEISFKIVNDALIAMTSNGGDFEGRMDRMSATLRLRMSNLNDSFFKLGRALSKNLLPILSDAVYNFSQLIEVIAKGVELVNEHVPSAWRWIGRGLLLTVLSVTGPIGFAITSLYLLVDDVIAFFQGRKSIIGLFVYGIKSVVGSLFDFTMQKINEILAAIQPILDLYNLYVGEEVKSIPYAEALAGDPSLAASPRDQSMIDNRGNVAVNQENIFNLATGSTEEVFSYMEQSSAGMMKEAKNLLSTKMRN